MGFDDNEIQRDVARGVMPIPQWMLDEPHGSFVMRLALAGLAAHLMEIAYAQETSGLFSALTDMTLAEEDRTYSLGVGEPKNGITLTICAHGNYEYGTDYTLRERGDGPITGPNP